MLKRSTLILIILSLVFLGIYFWLITPINTGLSVGPKFDWPDETANYFWIQHYAQTGQLVVAEPLNLVAQNQIHPRSFNVRPDGSLVPGSFLGLILLYGPLAKIFTPGAIIYFTPIFAIFGVLAFFGIIKKIFNEKVALISAIILLFHPVWWYYSATSMLPNVTFISCLLISLYFLLTVARDNWSKIIGAGLFAGLTLTLRPAESIWLLVVYLLSLVYVRKQFNLSRLILFFSIVFLIIVPSIYQQKILYGSIFTSGYSQLSAGQSNVCQPCQLVASVFLPFGFHPRLAAYNFAAHYLFPFWWLIIFALLGLVVFLKQAEKKKEISSYFFLSLFIFFWLTIYYGGWEFTDKLTLNLNTLGISYVRYWLPLYILALPFIALGLIWLSNLLRPKFKNIFLVLILIVLFVSSAYLVLIKKDDSLIPVKNRIAAYKQIAAEVISQTEPDSVIITSRKDKLFFPERKVIHTFDPLTTNQELLSLLPKLVPLTPVYYYALAPEPTLNLGNGISLEAVKNIGREVLYKIGQ